LKLILRGLLRKQQILPGAKMIHQKESDETSRSILDTMMEDCKLSDAEKKEMHPSLAGIFSGVSMMYSTERNIENLKSNWQNKAKYDNKSYRALFEHGLLDRYIEVRVKEILAVRDERDY